MQRRQCLQGLGAGLALLCGWGVQAQPLSSKPIRIMVPFGAGGVAALPLVVFTHVDDGCTCGNVAGVNLGYSSHGVLL